MWSFSSYFEPDVFIIHSLFGCLNYVLVSVGTSLYVTSSGKFLSAKINAALFGTGILVRAGHGPAQKKSSEPKVGCFSLQPSFSGCISECSTALIHFAVVHFTCKLLDSTQLFCPRLGVRDGEQELGPAHKYISKACKPTAGSCSL